MSIDEKIVCYYNAMFICDIHEYTHGRSCTSHLVDATSLSKKEETPEDILIFTLKEYSYKLMHSCKIVECKTRSVITILRKII